MILKMDSIHQIDLIVNRPLAVSIDYAEKLQYCLSNSLAIELPETVALEPRMESVHADHDGSSPEEQFIAVIPVHGSLAHRSSYFDLGYNTLKGWISSAVANPKVSGIVLEHASGGGEVAGLFDFCDWVRSISGDKEIWSIVNEHSYSADYCLAASTNRIIAPKSAGVGSIGVVMAHVDMSKAMKDAGYKVTLIHKGANKVLGNPYEPLSEELKSRLEASLDQPYEQMTEQLAAHLDMDQEELKKTEASTFGAEIALQKGLIHDVMSADDALAEFSEHVTSKTEFSIGGSSLGTPTGKKDESTKVSAETQALIDAAFEEGKASASADEPDTADIKKAESDRIMGILGHEEAVGREDLAKHLAAKGESIEDAVATLKISGKAAPSKGQSSGGAPDADAFAEGRKTDDVQTDVDEKEEESDEDDDKFGRRTASVGNVTSLIGKKTRGGSKQ